MYIFKITKWNITRAYIGPILFTIYINDICNVSCVVKCVLFADDTSIFCSERNITDLQLTLKS